MIPEKLTTYRQKGSILPMVAIGTVLFAVFLSFSIDIMRTIYTKSAMNYACKAAALAAYAFDPNETRFLGNASADLFDNPNLVALVAQTLASQSALYRLPKNMVPSGPDFVNNVYYTPAVFQFVANNLAANPADTKELFLQVPTQSAGDTGLQMLFYPTMFVSDGSANSIQLATQMCHPTMNASEEVIGQPASRIGAGPTQSQINADPSLVSMADCTVFPLAISYDDFVNKIAVSSLGTSFFLTLNSSITTSSSNWQSSPVSAYSTIKAAFVDVSGFPGTQRYYQYDPISNIQDLQSLLSYFLPGYNGTPPGCIERGSHLSVIDPASLSNQQLLSIINSLLNLQKSIKRYFILPVVSQSLPGTAGTQATVVGFALAKSQTMVSTGTNKIQFVFSSVGSVPLKNASSSNDLAAVPAAYNGSTAFAQAVPPIYPFTARQYNQATNSISSRTVSVALAPSLSARSPFHSFIF